MLQKCVVYVINHYFMLISSAGLREVHCMGLLGFWEDDLICSSSQVQYIMEKNRIRCRILDLF